MYEVHVLNIYSSKVKCFYIMSVRSCSPENSPLAHLPRLGAYIRRPFSLLLFARSFRTLLHTALSSSCFAVLSSLVSSAQLSRFASHRVHPPPLFIDLLPHLQPLPTSCLASPLSTSTLDIPLHEHKLPSFSDLYSCLE